MHGRSVSIHHQAASFARRSTTEAGRGLIQDDRQVLAQCNLFRELSAEESTSLTAHAHIRQYATDETIFLMGSTGDSMMVVLSGHVRISMPSPDGREIMLAILLAGDIFGDIAMLDRKERTADARAAGECRLAILNRRDVLAFFEKHPNAWPALVSTLCYRLRTADEQMAEIALMCLPVRLAKALLRLTGIEPRTGKHLSELRLSQRQIGSLIGATRESVNKWLGRWQRMGILHIRGSLITIVDRESLEELARLESSREAVAIRPEGAWAPRLTSWAGSRR